MDTLILVGVGLCQLALAGLGFHVTNHPPASKRWKMTLDVAFWVVGLIGVALLIWSGARTQKSQEALNAKIAELARGQQKGFGDVSHQIQAMPAPNITVTPAPVVTESAPSEAPKHAQISLHLYEVGHTRGATSPNEFNFNVHIKNTGQIHGDAPRRVAYTEMVSSQLDNKQLSEIVRATRAAAVKIGAPREKDRSQIEIDEPEQYFSVHATASPEETALFDSGKAWSYIMLAVTYRDPNTGRGYWVTEYCAARQPDGTINECGVGSRTWLHR